jgi:dolichyl-phosphate beta-glucosyltransferase
LKVLDFSLIIPSYNNAGELMRELPGLLSWLEARSFNPEVIIVNDGAPDVDELRQFCERNRFFLLRHETNMGKGAAVRTGMLHATKAIRIFTDADIPFQYEIFTEILKSFEDGKTMVVAGDRRKSDYFSKTPKIRRIGSSVFSWIVNVIMWRNLGDTQCGIKAFHSKVVESIFSKQIILGFAADIEWLYNAQKAGYPVKWVNAEFRNAGESSVVFWKQAIKMLRDVITLRMRNIF